MGRGSSGIGAGGGTAAAAPSTAFVPNVPLSAKVLTDQEVKDLREQQDSAYDPSTTAAVKMYISNTNFDGQMHSMSQVMNYLESEGVDLSTANLAAINRQFGLRLTPSDLNSMQYTSSYMAKAMHPLGVDTILQRGAHDDMLRQLFGIKDYSKLSQAQLQNQLVGKTFQNNSYMSSSYDTSKNPFLSSSSGVSGGREIIYNIKAGKNTKVLFGAKKQAEVIIDKGTDFKITGVHYNNKTATPRGGSYKPQLVIDIETY